MEDVEERNPEKRQQETERMESVIDVVRRDMQRVAIDLPTKSAWAPEQTGVTYAVIGKSFSGKTTFLVNELNKLTPDELGAYNAIIFFTESTAAEPLRDISDEVREKLILMDRFCPMVLRVIKKINNDTRNLFKFLIIFDDITQLRGELLTKCILTLRNANISTIFSMQYEKLMNPAQRSSVHNMYIFNLRTESWNFLLSGFILGNIKDVLPALKYSSARVSEVSQIMRETVDPYIIYYDQRRDLLTFYKK